MKTTFYFFILCFASLHLLGQKYGNIWHFGDKVGLDFNTCEPVVITNGKNIGFEGCATISDANGQLLFYTNSDSVWNRQHARMPNGNLINSGGTLSQVLIIPRPGSSTKYYIFTTLIQGSGIASLKLQYHEVDMSLNGGLGDVSSKNNTMTTATVTEQAAATWHSNGTDIWVMTHEYGTSNFMAYLVTAAGVAATPVVSTTGPAHITGNSNFNARGQIKFSPNGTLLAFNGNGDGLNNATNILTVFNFNNSTGLVSNPMNLPFFRGDFGLSFSSDNTKLYGATWKAFNFTSTDFNYLYQYDLSAPNPAATGIKLDSTALTNSDPYGDLKLAPDGKIYVTRGNKSFLGVINSPTLAGVACNYVSNGVSLGGKTCKSGLNNYIEYQSYCRPTLTGLTSQTNNQENPGVFPNPFSGTATLRFYNPHAELYALYIYDCQGKLVKSIDKISGNSVDLESHILPAGMYFYSLSSGTRLIKGKMVIEPTN